MKFIALDLETTGLDPENDTIIEVAAIKFANGEIIEEFRTLVNPMRQIPPIAMSITGITDEMVKDAKPFEEHLENLREFIGTEPILGQNIKFDIGFLKTHGLVLENKQLDTFVLARAVIPQAQSYSLEILAESLNIKNEGSHRAYEDALTSVKLMEKLQVVLAEEKDEVLDKIKNFLEKQEWSWKKLLLDTINNRGEYRNGANGEKDIATAVEEHGAPHEEEVLPELTIPLQGKKITEGFIDPEKYDFSEKTLVAMPGSRAFYFPKHTFKLKYNYLLPEAFEKLLAKKNKWNEDEVTAFIKLIIWFSKTKTYETSELSLYNKEYSIINRINLEEHMEHEIYANKLRELEKRNKIYISHSNLLKTATLNLNLGLNIKNLVILDAIDFEKSLAKNMTTSIGVGDMEGEGEMLFGLLGIIFEKFKPEDLAFPEIEINEFIKESREWKNVQSTAKKTIENFEPHVPPKLQLLSETFATPEKFDITLMHAIEGDILIRITPKNILELIDEKIWRKFDNIIVNDDAIEFKNDEFLKNALGLQDFETKKTAQNMSAEFTYFPDMPDPKQPDYPNKTAKKIAGIRNDYKNIIVIFAANGPISSFITKITHELDNAHVNIFGQGVSGSNGKIINKIQTDGSNVILANFDFALELVEIFKEKNMDEIALVFVKLPFMHPNNPYMRYMETQFAKPYDMYSLPKAKCAILKLLRRYKHTFKNVGAYILDGKMGR